ncbi:energy transducer TonB [Myxococcaceae bacterium GXIMD 01537]
MFQSVIEQGGMLRTGRFGTGAGVSVAAHAAVLAAVLLLSGRVAEEEPELPKEMPVLRLGAPAPPKGNPRREVATQIAPKSRKPREQRVPREVPKALPAAVEPPKTEPTDTVPPDVAGPDVGEPGDEGTHPLGVDFGGIKGVPLPPVLTNLGGATGEDVLAFGDGMSPPKLLSNPGIELPREALVARVEGTVVAKCVITLEGEVDGCRIIKGLPLVDEAVRAALESRRYSPVTFQGRAVSVSYSFNIHIRQPR